MSKVVDGKLVLDLSDFVSMAVEADEEINTERFKMKAGRLVRAIRIEATRWDLVALMKEANAARDAYDKELAEKGSWSETGPRQSNVTRWRKAADDLALAVLGRKVVG